MKKLTGGQRSANSSRPESGNFKTLILDVAGSRAAVACAVYLKHETTNHSHFLTT